MPTTLSIPGVNRGQPFHIGPELLSPRAVDAAMAAKTHVLRDGMKGLGEYPEAVQKEIMDDVNTRAAMAQASAMVWAILCRVDPSLAQKGKDAVMDDLSVKDWEALMQAVSPEEDKEKSTAPLADPPSADPPA